MPLFRGTGCQLCHLKGLFEAVGFLKSRVSRFPVSVSRILISKNVISLELISEVKKRPSSLIFKRATNSMKRSTDPVHRMSTSSMNLSHRAMAEVHFSSSSWKTTSLSHQPR
ncbi:hypothetical protein GDO81_028178 [Engystomops pustulosus]|uniref:Uncharacterized protein n=1 Tax=Engystomops pustulosus TaxID=76066 RepID=A0AAV6YK02_ENGPU|nr:hypothetical protein GDO81_028178 [Engystomops pustulosus]